METSFVLDKRNHYPYDCPESHCILDEEHCQNKCCLAKIAARCELLERPKFDLLGESERMAKEIDAMNEETGSPWAR
jgi:hypothetical protein